MRPSAVLALLGTTLLATLLAPAPARAERPARVLPEGASVTFEHGDARVGTYVSSPWGFSTNTFWIEGPTGVILIDTQFLPSAIEEAVSWIERATQKKIVLAVVLHANPDKFNGTGFLKAHGVRVVTSEEVRALIPGVHEKRVKWFYDRYQPDYPKTATLPESFGKETTELSAGGVTLKAHVLGPGCSEAHVAVEYDRHLFTGDLVANGVHSWFELGRIQAWRERIAELTALSPKYVHPGRGPSGGAELLVRQKAYLEKTVALVSARSPTGPGDSPANAAAIAAVKSELEAAYPGYRFGAFLDLGLPAVWDALRDSPAARAPIAELTAPALLAMLRESKAKAVVVNVWATWCAPCVEELPDILRVFRKYRDRGVELILISGDSPSERANAEAKLAQLGVDFPSWLKTGQDMQFIDAIDRRWTGALPATFVFARGGKIAYFTEGQINAAKLEDQLRGVLGTNP